MISRARSSAIAFSAWAAVSAAVGWYLAWMSGCLRRKASLRRKSLTSLFASVASSQARCRPLACPAQRGPGPRRRLERVLDEVRGKLAVTAGPHARVAEQPPVMGREEIAQLGDVALRDPGFAAIVHAAPPPASTWVGPGRSSLSAS